MSRYYLGLDVGGTATRWALADEDGRLVKRGALSGATGHLFAEQPRADFVRMIQSVAAALDRYLPLAGVHAGVTGLGPKAFAEARTIMTPALGAAPSAIALDDDIALAYRAAFAPGAGHLISVGTGSIGLHIKPDGEVVRVGGRGLLIDDGGSGTWIALTALNRLYRLIDGQGAPVGAEILAKSLAAGVGGDSWDDARAYVYGSDRGRIGMLAPCVAQAASAGDPLALEILVDAAHELARLARALIGRAGNLPVAFVGGIIALHPVIKQTLAADLSGVETVFPKIDAAATAALLARDADQPATE
jgi:glucosamine kinase